MSTLLDILPYNANMILVDPTIKQKTLDVVNDSIDLILETIDAVNNNRVYDFDPHIGDTACQIRAYELCLLLNELNSINDSVIESLTSVKQKLLIERKKIFQRQSLISLLSNVNALIRIDETLIYLSKIKYLSKFTYYDNDDNTRISITHIKNSQGISKHLANKLVHKYQVEISQHSVDFVLSLAATLSHEIPYEIKQYVKLDDDNRTVMPCFLSTKLIYQHSVLNRIPITIAIVSLTDIDCAPIIIHSNQSMVSSPSNSIVFYGVSSILNKYNRQKQLSSLLHHGLKTIIFSNQAAHPQYSGNRLSEFNVLPYSSGPTTQQNKPLSLEYEYYKNFALANGYTSTNQQSCYIRHVYTGNTVELRSPNPEQSLIRQSTTESAIVL